MIKILLWSAIITLFSCNNMLQIHNINLVVDGHKNGKWIILSNDSSLKELITYKNGYKDGLYKSFFFDGQIAIKGYYKDGLKHGRWQYYSQKGFKGSSFLYKNGESIKSKIVNLKNEW